MLPAALTDVLVCPKSKQPLLYFPRGEADGDEREGFLLCPASRLRYRIDDGIAVLLIEEASEVSDADVERLLRRAKDLKLPGA